jgi:CHAD domain-containing protein
MVRARTHHREADFHEWRKAIKILWYQLRLVEACSPKIRLDVGALHRAQTWLGDDHNVVVLCEELSKNASLCGRPSALARLRVAAEQLQCDARKKAVATITGIYARPTRDYLRHITRAWKKSLKRGKRRKASARRRAAA